MRELRNSVYRITLHGPLPHPWQQDRCAYRSVRGGAETSTGTLPDNREGQFCALEFSILSEGCVGTG